ncbi:hypothetical protein PTQ27_09440 [Mannheimia sp. AT1]|uniref:Uncharacterized protein n=1 Tax=Mannheimia cairinae TaxID=3025936 RepID=A0ABT5MSV1_9PAST|nr:hypothetical protein [Mannheimia cairinae]MDD0824681.1 hypothetical protein [Mannheimia cairinae]MDD0826390.1 hypothetical protein [Mannheimia cairinae]
MKTLIEQRNELNALYSIVNYNGQLVIDSLIWGIDCILSDEERTIDAFDSNESELKERVNNFYSNIENYL